MLEVRNLTFTYQGLQGAVHAVKDVSFTLRKGEFFSLLGPSGCGKSTTLRCVAGLEQPSGGEISIDHEVVFSSERKTFVSPSRRNIAMVFQSYAVWPHLSVLDNVLLPLTKGRRKLAGPRARERAMEALGLVHLEHLADRMAPMLSGGQQQRVAVARAFALEPAVLLLDEPLSNLDAKLREEMRAELKTLVKRLHVTTLYVTHDQAEALGMSDRFAVMLDGRMIQSGSPMEMYAEPRAAFVASFLGRANLIPGRVLDSAALYGQCVKLETNVGTLKSRLATSGANAAMVLCRPEHVVLVESDPIPMDNVISGQVVEKTYQGHCSEIVVDCVGQRICLMEPGHIGLEVGSQVRLHLPPQRCQAIEA